MKYRAEIDGLRAIAVVPVILFHAGFQMFSGGFVGVDIFFVISGYLITTILMEDLENKRFSIISFYERRARRILPALFFVILCCLPFAWMWMLPSQLKDFSKSLVAASIFASNIQFWSEGGYFAAPAEQKPLLHTWSLAVEEQYYVLFPVFLFLAWRMGRNPVFWMIVVFASLSLALSEWGWRNDANANFYLAPARAWELFAGSIAAFIAQRHGVKSNNILAMVGLFAILGSIFLYNEDTPFPSVYALVPVLGVVLIVLFADSQTIVAKLLSTKLLVGLGLISYSAYLWHQPLFAFARIRSLSEPGELLMLGLCVLSIVLGILSWRYIERPFRSGSGFIKSKKMLFTFSFSSLAVLLVAGSVGYAERGFPNRFDMREENFSYEDKSICTRENLSDDSEIPELLRNCFSKNDERKFILVGDSHAKSISKALRDVIEKNSGQLITLEHDGCLPIPGTSRKPLQESCLVAKAFYWALAKQTNATIVFSTRWRLNMLGTRYDNGEGGVEVGKSGRNFVVQDEDSDIFKYAYEKLLDLSLSNKLILLSQAPEAGWNVPERQFKLHIHGIENRHIDTSYEIYKERNAPVIDWLKSLAKLANIDVLKIEDLVCSDDTLRCMVVKDSTPLYRDDDHPSPLFAEMIASQFESSFLAPQLNMSN